MRRTNVLAVLAFVIIGATLAGGKMGGKPQAFLLASTVLAVIAATPARADDVEDYPPGTQLPFGYVRSIDAFANGLTTSLSLDLASEYAAMMHQTEQAVAFARLAIKKDDDEIDAHKALAQALQQKLALQSKKDPKLLIECVKEWLIVLRSERGPEKGLTKKNGKGNAKFNKFYEDEDHAMAAAQALQVLTGKVPKANESDEAFLKDTVQKPDLEVTGKLLNGPSSRKPVAKPADPLDWMNQ